MPQSAMFGFLDISNKDYLIVNHLLFKCNVYNAKDQTHLVFEALNEKYKEHLYY